MGQAMARKRRGQPVHGWIVLDKPLGMSSSRAVGAVRRILDAAKAGHGGTLDPLATGVLPIALGEATKTVAYAMGSRKRYRFTLRWGEARSTDDGEGAVIATSAARPSREEILAALPAFEGTTLQRPPDFSAIKLAGQRAYDLARGGGNPVLAPRPIEIARLEFLGMPDSDHAEFAAEVGKGTYIRALGRDLGLALGCYAHVTALCRVSVGRFTLDAAISLAKLEAVGHSPAASGHLLPIETALDDIPALALSGEEAEALRCGRVVTPLRPSDRARIDLLGDGATIRATSDGRLVALAAIDKGLIRPVRVINF
jgi:tRNA pseudouridine55 synthase